MFMKGSSNAQDKKGYEHMAHVSEITKDRVRFPFHRVCPVFLSPPGLLNLLDGFHDRCKQAARLNRASSSPCISRRSVPRMFAFALRLLLIEC